MSGIAPFIRSLYPHVGMADRVNVSRRSTSLRFNLIRPESSPPPALVPAGPSDERVRTSGGTLTAVGEFDPTAPEVTPGTFIGRFQLLSILGKGGQSVVYLARDPFLDELVAVKQLSLEYSGDPEMRARFIGEGRITRSMSGDRVVTIHDLGEEHGRPYLVMQLHKETLADRLEQRDRRLDPTHTVQVLVHELHACLQALSRRGVIHRDIKPSNLLVAGTSVDAGDSKSAAMVGPHESFLDPGERLVLADFGLARSTDRSSITLGAGTSGYMAPEQTRPGVELDHRSDIFSATALVANWVAMSGAQVSDEVKATFARGMAYDRTDRHPNADEWMAAFDSALSADRSFSSVRPVLLGMLVAVLLLVLVVGAQLRAMPDTTPIQNSRPGTTNQALALNSRAAPGTTTGSDGVIDVVSSVQLASKSKRNEEVEPRLSVTSTTAQETEPLQADSVSVSAVVPQASESPEELGDSCATGQQEADVELQLESEFGQGSANLDLNGTDTIDGVFETTSSSEISSARAQLTGTDRATDCTDRNQNDE